MSMQRQFQCGYSLPELALVIVVLGLLVIAATTVIRDTQKMSDSVEAQALFRRADNALSGFVYANGRLPCPAAAGVAGVEDCGLTNGVLPYQTLGMAAQLRNQEGLAFRYAVYAKTGATTLDAQLNKKSDRIQPFYATATPLSSTSQNLGNASDMDLCRALSNGWDATADATYAHTTDGNSLHHIAYVLADPGAIDADQDGNLFDGYNVAGVKFGLPSRGISANYDDQVHAVYFDEIWEWMSCSGILSAVVHAHPNAKSTTAIYRQALVDYKVQLELAVEFAEASNATAAAQALQAGAGLATAASLLPAGTATTLLMVPVGPYVTGPAAVGLAVGAIAVNTAAVAAAVLGVVYLNENLIPLTEKMVSLIEEVIPILTTLDTSVEANVKAADQAGIYER
ncbi:MAG: prepilin-type N-terminal cleavage/methylation domain-containing protein [Methylobacter sp.]|nr:prepilin-type N-terminal cleavage/methylation domain-containing protein [Methylobacter sp.]